jgi:threonine/homoserine/homoserine lactone efflux protein
MTPIWLGVTSSFIGALPLGMLNLSVLKLSLAGRQSAAFTFSLGVVFVEFFQILLTLTALPLFLALPQLNAFLQWVSIPILCFLGYKAWEAPRQNATEKQPHFIGKHFFAKGIGLSLANVLIYPFWVIWGNTFVQNGVLSAHFSAFFSFSMGACFGTMAAFCIFIFLGKALKPHLQKFEKHTNRLISLAFFGFAGFQVFTRIK